MFSRSYAFETSWRDRLREGLARRTTGIVAALLLEALLVLLLLTLGQSDKRGVEKSELIATFDAAPEQSEPDAPPEPEPQPNSPQAEPTPQPVPEEIPPPQPVPSPAAVIPTRKPSFDISALPSPETKPAPPKQSIGPAFRPRPGDSERVGTAPNGEPLYAARWYREPYDSELAGYLSTARGPGWALIACKTVPEFRVEDCVALAEYPDNSQMARAVLAAAWQFKVRPPQLRGQPMYGEWVRIRIDYEYRPPQRLQGPALP